MVKNTNALRIIPRVRGETLLGFIPPEDGALRNEDRFARTLRRTDALRGTAQLTWRQQLQTPWGPGPWLKPLNKYTTQRRGSKNRPYVDFFPQPTIET